MMAQTADSWGSGGNPFASPPRRTVDPARKRKTRRRGWMVVGAVVAVAAGATCWLALGGTSSLVLPGGPYHVRDAHAIAVQGSHIWVASGYGPPGGSVTELSARPGRPVRVLRTISAHADGVGDPVAIAVAGRYIWVASAQKASSSARTRAGTLAELSSATGRLVRVVSASRDKFARPSSIAVAKGRIWLTSNPTLGKGWVTEINARSGRLIRVINGHQYGFNLPSEAIASGGRIWVVNNYSQGSSGTGGLVTEINARTGQLIRLLQGRRYNFNGPVAIAASGGRLWVTNIWPQLTGGSVVELSEDTGQRIRTIAGSGTGLDSPDAIVLGHGRAWVANAHEAQTGGSVTEIDASNGATSEIVPASNWVTTLIRSSRYQLSHPEGLALQGDRLWIATQKGLTVLPAS